jgi:serine/threonine protein kinase
MAESQAPTRIASSDENASDGAGSAWSDPPPPDAERDPLLGTVLNHTYTLVRLLGTGGMGRVYEATHSRIRNKRFAIKVLHPELAFSAEVRTRFQREAEAAACVAHPNAVSIFDVALTAEGWPYLVCEFLEGRELAALLKSHGRLPSTQSIEIAVQVARALVEAHKGGVVHRDLKPHNVFLVGDFERGLPEQMGVKVLDFGLSRFLEGGNELTKTGAILGTPSYMAPEQARGERADHRTDVYGVGAVLYACVTGRSPFRGDTPQAVLLAVMSNEPPRPSALNPFVSPELELVIQRAMARNPDERYPDMSSLREALEQLAEHTGHASESRGLRRLPLGSITNEEAPASARFDLVFYLLLAALFVMLACVSSIVGLVVVWFGAWPLTSMETLLAALVVVGTLLTPTLLLLFRLRRTVWSNTARVVEFLTATKRSLNVGLLAYGTLAVLLTFWDYAGAHLLGALLPLGGSALSWAGLPATLLASAGFIVAAELVRGKLVAQGGWVNKLGSEAAAKRRRWLAGPGLFAIALLLSSSTVVIALASRDAATPTPAKVNREPAEPKRTPPPGGQTRPTAPPPSGKGQHPTQTPPTEASAAKAKDSELQKAKTGGSEALALLLTRYPKDPAVARALGIQYAATAATLLQSLEAFSKLFELDPEASKDKEVRQLVAQMLSIDGPVKKRAFDLLAFEMGYEGTDQLYRLALTDAGQKDEAMRHLAEARKEGTVSEALAVAMDLQFNSSCEDRVSLLPAAAKHGDERSQQVLSALATAKRGCGKRKRELCKPVCPAQAEQFRSTVEAISERLIAERDNTPN